MKEESILDTHTVTADKFGHTSNTQRENANAIFTSEKLDKSDDMEDALKGLAINDAAYYESNSATVSDAQGDPTRDLETVTHISNGNEKATGSSKGSSEQNILNNRTLPIVAPTMSPRVDPRIVLIVAAPQTLLTPEMKEVVADPACVGAWVNRNSRRLSRTGINGITPGEIFNAVSVKNANSSVPV